MFEQLQTVTLSLCHFTVYHSLDVCDNILQKVHVSQMQCSQMWWWAY